MIYAAGLSIPVKKAMRKQAMQSNVNKIIEKMCLDPATTYMDVVVLGPSDVIGPNKIKLSRAIENKHEKVCVIYLYTKDSEKDLIKCQYSKQLRKMRDTEVKAAIEEFISTDALISGKSKVSSADFRVLEEPKAEETPFRRRRKAVAEEPAEVEEVVEEVAEEVEEVVEEAEEPVGEEVQEVAEKPDELTYPEVEKATEEYVAPVSELLSKPPVSSTPLSDAIEKEMPHINKIEDTLGNIKSQEDWEVFKENLNRDSVIRHLIEENTEYAGLITMLDVLDNRIKAIWTDCTLTPDQKFDKIKEIGLERATMRAATNSINVDKVIGIINAITLSAKRIVEERVNSLDTSLYKITTDKEAIVDTSVIDKAITERSKVQVDLMNTARDVVELYKSMQLLVTDSIASLDQQLPSANEFINNMVKPIGTQIFTPQNTAELTKRLLQALQENRITTSQLETLLNNTISLIFNLCERDQEVITLQKEKLELLAANRVEDVVIRDTLLKNSLRLFVGADNSGRSATAITWCGVLSRRHNTLLIDLTGRDKFETYGIAPMSLNDFMCIRVEKPFVCVKSDRILSPEEMQTVVAELKSRLNYYANINIILAPEDENNLDALSTEALCVHYVTNCSNDSIKIMHDVVAKHTSKNVARKLVMIDTPVSPLMIAESIGVDFTRTRLITIPNIPTVRACAIRHDRPYEFEDTVRVFEEAFR